jgi:hypothetical protein
MREETGGGGRLVRRTTFIIAFIMWRRVVRYKIYNDLKSKGRTTYDH